MKKASLIGVALVAGALIGGAAHAGMKSSFPVEIDMTKRTAEGSMGTARNSSDELQFIGCRMSLDSAVCDAMDAGGNYVGCYAANPSMTMRSVLASINGDSFIMFSWNERWECTGLQVHNNSRWVPISH